MATPHDALFKRVFSQPRHAVGELRHLLPPELVEEIDWQTLTLVSGSLVDSRHRDRHADLLFSVNMAGHQAFLYLLFEHKSSSEALTAFQLLIYVVRIWKRFLSQNPRVKKIPMIVPFVVHHSNRGWSAATDVRELIQVPSHLRDTLRPLLPSFPFLLDDLAAESSESLRQRAMNEMAKITLFCLQRARHSGDLLAELRSWTETVRSLLTAPDRATAFRDTVLYIWKVTHLSEDEVRQFLTVEIGPESEQLMKTTYDRIVERSKAAMLLRQLQARFGDLPAEVTERVRSASADHLDLWAIAVLEARTLEEVFAT